MIVLRSLAFQAYFYVLTTTLVLFGIPVRIVAPSRQIDLARAWCRLVLKGAEKLCGVTLELTGQEHLPAAGPALLASQHQSAFDTFIWMLLVRDPTYVVKQELIRIPLFGPLLSGAGMIGVDRKAGAPALKQLVRDAVRAKEAGRQIIIFPEGTRVAFGKRVPLQPGIAALAARLDLPVIPIATDSGRRWKRRAIVLHPGPVTVAICPPLAQGTPRATLLPAIAAAWREAEKRFPDVVDNSVEQPPQAATS